jgi:hypothetical protein
MYGAGVSFLQRFADPRVESFFAFVRANLPRLFEREERFLATHVKGFGECESAERN